MRYEVTVSRKGNNEMHCVAEATNGMYATEKVLSNLNHNATSTWKAESVRPLSEDMSTQELEAELARRKTEEASHIVECWESNVHGNANTHRILVDDRSYHYRFYSSRRDEFGRTIVPFMQRFENMGYQVEIRILGDEKRWFYKREPQE
jgi:hypothetical protein